MNKTELIEEIAKEAGISKAASGKAVDAFTASVTTAMKGGNTGGNTVILIG